MLRSILARGASVARTASKCKTFKPVAVVSTPKAYASNFPTETGDTSKDFIDQFNRTDLSGYDVRELVTYMQGLDYIPDSNVIETMMRACRRVNDYALAIRIMESIKWKCGNDAGLFTSLIAPVQPTLDELGILSIEQMGYDKPEMYLQDVFDIH